MKLIYKRNLIGVLMIGIIGYRGRWFFGLSVNRR